MSRFENRTPWNKLEEMENVCGLCESPMSISSDSDEDSEPWIEVENKRMKSIENKRMKSIQTKSIQTVETPQKVVPISLKFQVTSVNKPLLSVKRVTEKGNHVSFGPKAEDNFIVNKITGDKILLRPNGKGSYLMDVKFENGGKTAITLDSGAEESVCPRDWGSQFGLQKADQWLNFKGANGSKIDHYGQRSVKVFSPFQR